MKIYNYQRKIFIYVGDLLSNKIMISNQWLPRLSMSLDLNPKENLWQELNVRINCRLPKSLQEFDPVTIVANHRKDLFKSAVNNKKKFNK